MSNKGSDWLNISQFKYSIYYRAARAGKGAKNRVIEFYPENASLLGKLDKNSKLRICAQGLVNNASSRLFECPC